MGLSTESGIKLYQSVADENKDRVFKHWHCSSLAMCPRAHYFKRLGIASLNKPKGGKVIRWQAGHLLEEVLRKHINTVWGETTSNKRLTSEELDLTGEYDNLTEDGKTLIEVKSVSDWAFYKGKETTDIVLKEQDGTYMWRGREVKKYVPKKTAYKHHLIQNHGYVLLHPTIENIDFVYTSLSGLLCVYKTQVNEELLKWVKQRLQLLNEAWESQTPPECVCSPDQPLWDEQNQWCDYKEEDKCCDPKLAEKIQVNP